jgi:hypothetical protein
MAESFLKALRWFLFIACIIAGIAAFNQLEVQGMKVGILVVVSFGGAYIMSKPWRALPPKAMVLSVLGVAALAFMTQYVPGWYTAYTGEPAYDNFYFIWLGLVLVLGVPFMMWVFERYDED